MYIRAYMYIHVLGTYRCAVAVQQLVTVKWRLVTFLKQKELLYTPHAVWIFGSMHVLTECVGGIPPIVGIPKVEDVQLSSPGMILGLGVPPLAE